jgi:cytochrome P450
VLGERIAADADACIDAMLAGERPADLVTAYAVPIPARTICHLLGVPFADSAFFQAQVAKVSAAGGEDKAVAFAEVHAYLDALVRAKELAPTDDLLGRLVCEQLRPGAIDHATLVGIAVILLMAGFDSTASMIALSVATLFRWPEQRALLAADPGLMQGAVEELLRFHTLGDADALRVAIADVEIGGRQIRAGEGVIPLVWSANRDEAVFERPDEFDVRRQAHGQLAFGHGIHQCLGLNLARIELRIALRTLFARLPGLRPAIALEAMPWRHESEVFGLLALPVAW